MKKQLIYFLLALTAVCLGACNNDDEIDTAHSIFSTEPVERNAFDDWLLDNYTYPYNKATINTILYLPIMIKRWHCPKSSSTSGWTLM